MIIKIQPIFVIAWFFWLSLITYPALSEEQAVMSQELQAAVKAMEAAKQIGPADIRLRNQAVLKLPRGYQFIPTPAASAYARALGSTPGEGFVGLIFPEQGDSTWAVVVEYVDSGFIKDDEAKTWNTDDLLSSYKQGTEANNNERIKRGFPALEVAGWVEKPRYDDSTHRLVWSMAVRSKGHNNPSDLSVNYNTYALGREGYFSLNLVTDYNAIWALKLKAQALLAGLQFNEGKSYADFNESTDKVAEYGLAALIGGVAAKKLGFLALGTAFFAKFAKLIIAGAVVFGASRKLFKRKKTDRV